MDSMDSMEKLIMEWVFCFPVIIDWLSTTITFACFADSLESIAFCTHVVSACTMSSVAKMLLRVHRDIWKHTWASSHWSVSNIIWVHALLYVYCLGIKCTWKDDVRSQQDLWVIKVLSRNHLREADPFKSSLSRKWMHFLLTRQRDVLNIPWEKRRHFCKWHSLTTSKVISCRAIVYCQSILLLVRMLTWEIRKAIVLPDLQLFGEETNRKEGLHLILRKKSYLISFPVNTMCLR